MSKQRFLGGLLGANPLRDGSFEDTTIELASGGPLRFDDPTYGAMASGCSMGSYTSDGITLTNSSGGYGVFALDLNLANFTSNFFVHIEDVPNNTELAVSTSAASNFSLTSSQSLIAVAGTAVLEHTSAGFSARSSSEGTGTQNTGHQSMCLAYNASAGYAYFGYKNNHGGDVFWLQGSDINNQSTSSSWTATLPTSDPTFNGYQGVKSLLIKLPAGTSVEYYAENWDCNNTPSGFDELRLAPYSAPTSVAVSRTTSNVGILSLDEAGPEANGSNDLTQINWGGIRGRDTVVNETLANTGILSLNELFVSSIIPDGTILDRAGQHILDRNGNYITTR